MANRSSETEWAAEQISEAIKGIYKPNAPLDEIAGSAEDVREVLLSINKNLDRIASALETMARKA